MGELVELQPIRRRPKPLWREALGEVLRRERLGQERILTEVATVAGVSPQYLSEIERGRKEPSSEVLGAVTEALGLELHDVVRRVGASLEARHETARREAERRTLLELAQALPTAPRGGAEFAPPQGGVYLLAA